MPNVNEPNVNKAVVEQAIRHINHHGSDYGYWYVGIEDEGGDRDNSVGRHPMRYEMNSEEEAKLTMSWLLGMGLTADDEYGAEPTILFIYLNK